MTDQHDTDERDEALIDELRGMFARADPMPTHVLDAARAAIEFRDLDGQLAELLSDSAVEEPDLVGVRGTTGRLLTFAKDDRFLEVDVTADGGDLGLTGYVVPSVAGELIAEHRDGAIRAGVDAEGRFRMPRVPRGLLRLRFVSPGLPVFVTPWLPI